MSVAVGAGTAPAVRGERLLAPWWPLLALTALAAALRFSTLGAQSLWYDEAFTPVHVLHPGLGATLHSVVHTENTPPLWYVLEWAITRVLGTGAVALRLLSAFAGVATVPVAWAIGRELSSRRSAVACAALVAVNPLFVWYSQEARAYALFVLFAAVAMLYFLRALREERRGHPGAADLAAFALTGSLALLTHYFAVFLLAPMVLWLLWASDRRRAVLGAIGSLGIVCLALLPLISAQGGHGTQWIGRWALGSRLQAIPQYYLTSYYGAALGHGIELLVALAILAGLGFGLWRVLTPREERGALIALTVAAGGVLLPILLVAFGADYLAPRNLVAAMIPVTALIAVVVTAQRTGRVGPALAGLIAIAFLSISLDVDLSPRLQRGNWRGVARTLSRGAEDRVITTVELGAAPLEYYLPPLHNLPRGASVSVVEIDETGYAPLRRGAADSPAPGFRLADRRDINGLILYRFLSPVARTVSEATLRRHVITLAHPEVLISERVLAQHGAGERDGQRSNRVAATRAHVVVNQKDLAFRHGIVDHGDPQSGKGGARARL
jgi:mannosyltransferase